MEKERVELREIVRREQAAVLRKRKFDILLRADFPQHGESVGGLAVLHHALNRLMFEAGRL